MFLGELSSRIYIRHHAEHSDAIVMTGAYNDPLIEDTDMYPVYDVLIHEQLMKALGYEEVLSDPTDTLLICSLVGDRQFINFAELRHDFIQALYGSMQRERRSVAYPNHSVAAEIGRIAANFEPRVSNNDLGNAGALVARLVRVTELAKERQTYFEEEFAKVTGRESPGARVIALHVATDLEEEVARELLPALGWTYAETRASAEVSYNRYVSFESEEIILVRSSAGSSVSHGSLYTATKLFSAIRPHKLISVGICFGMDEEKQNFEDVIVSERIAHYESARMNEDGTRRHRGEKSPADAEVVSRARSLRAIERKYKIHVGPTLSGDKLIDDAKFRDELRDFEEKAIGGDMEAAGLAVACAQAGVGYAMVKGIADFASRKDKDKQRPAAENAIRLALEMIKGGFA